MSMASDASGSSANSTTSFTGFDDAPPFREGSRSTKVNSTSLTLDIGLVTIPDTTPSHFIGATG